MSFFQDLLPHSVPLRQRALLYEHVSALVEGGVPLVKALKTFTEKTSSEQLRRELLQLSAFIEMGDTLSTAMKKLPRTFERQESAIVEAGEQSGTLNKALTSLSNELRATEDLIAKVKGALTYPIIVFVFLFAALAIVMAYVVPKMVPLFESINADLPGITKSLIVVSDFLRGYVWYLVGMVILVSISLKLWLETESGRLMWDTCLLRVPVAGKMLRNYLVVRSMSTLSLLIGAGIPILKTFDLVIESVGNREYQRMLRASQQRIMNGSRMTSAFEEEDPAGELFPADVIQMIAAGEQTSALHTTCARVADRYRRELDYSLAALVKIVEPIALVIAAVFVAWFAGGIFSAILQIVTTVEQG